MTEAVPTALTREDSAATHRAPGPGASPDERDHRFRVLTLAALGVVYGDIGTSPLYAFKEVFKPQYGLRPDSDTILGVCSVVVWSLVLVVAFKYLTVMLRADNRGEGGVVALVALLFKSTGKRRTGLLLTLGIFGAALLYGDALITPAISVLGAVEGLEVTSPGIDRLTVPIALAILLLLFVFQRRGTAVVGKVFGPTMTLWFLVVAVAGALAIIREPSVLQAVAPWFAVRFFAVHGWTAFFALGAVVLVVTGSEALYADLGHFGAGPIRVGWFAVVMPALLLNYLGQGALLIREPAAAQNPFYHLVSGWERYALLGLATIAAIIASQAVISGVFSLTRQYIGLELLPRLTIMHTSAEQEGQIYMPGVNRALMIGCIAMVLVFRSATGLAGAYGVAVSGTMAITTVLFFVVARDVLGWSAVRAGIVCSSFLIIDLAFLAANLRKVPSGGWFPLLVALVILFVVRTWTNGHMAAEAAARNAVRPLAPFAAAVRERPDARMPGTGVFLTTDVSCAPESLVTLDHLLHAVPDQVVVLAIGPDERSRVPSAERLEVKTLEGGFVQATTIYGYVEHPRMTDVLVGLGRAGVVLDIDDTVYVLSDDILTYDGADRMSRWRKQLYGFMARNQRRPDEFFDIPLRRVVRIGLDIQI